MYSYFMVIVKPCLHIVALMERQTSENEQKQVEISESQSTASTKFYILHLKMGIDSGWAPKNSPPHTQSLF